MPGVKERLSLKAQEAPEKGEEHWGPSGSCIGWPVRVSRGTEVLRGLHRAGGGGASTSQGKAGEDS